ncbi:hypothetical protein NM208_g8135 [Fusarium decemcellulare]|uniref:Uncharacterized protein n=1 Tax=Fusarium decemcellulare TaxID=57161 RepID=A0ACC1S6I4_9HYPO|nr:hypothetical protein NM208_g8135 [Fusarium decemcellulare]
MAEPISLAASVAGLLDVGLRTSKALHGLQRELRNAPDLIRALSNEVEDIKAVLARIGGTIKDSEASGLNSTIGAAILVDLEAHLGKAKIILTNLDSLAQKLMAETPTLKRVKWCLKKSRAAELQTDLKEVRTRINDSSSTRIQLQVQDVRIGIQQHQQAVIQQLDTTSQTISNQLTSARNLDSQRHAEIAATLQVLQASLSNLPQSLNDQLAVVRDEIAKFNQARAEIETKPTRLVSDTRGSIPGSSTLAPPEDSGTGRVFTHVSGDDRPRFSSGPPAGFLNSSLFISLGMNESRCKKNCPCRCHGPPTSHRFWKFPQILNAVFGSLFVGYSGYPVSSSSCNLKECSNGRYIRLRFTYGFPLWFFNYAVNVFLEASTSKFTCALRARRRITLNNSETNILYHVQWSGLDTIQHCLEMNRASVLDVYHLDGQSALDLALSPRRSAPERLQVIKALLQAGIDPDQEDDYGISTRLKIAQWSVFGLISKELEALFNTSECISNLDMTFLHQVILGQCHVDLVATLQSRSPDILSQVNAQDRLGFTPLMYAVMHGDVRKAKALLDAGASIDEQAPDGSTAFMKLAYALELRHVVELGHLLLAAGADVHATSREGTNTLHLAARYNNTELIKMLVPRGARIDCRDIYGNTPLLLAMQYNSLQALRCLFDQGADIDELDEHGRSLLNTSIMENSHDLQRMLLELGANYLYTNKFGTLLHYAAYFGDEGTFNTLASLMLPGLDINAEDDWGWTAVDCFENRSQVSDVVRSAFYELLEVVRSNQLVDEAGEDWSDSNDDFEDASEFLDDSGILDQD